MPGQVGVNLQMYSTMSLYSAFDLGCVTTGCCCCCCSFHRTQNTNQYFLFLINVTTYTFTPDNWIIQNNFVLPVEEVEFPDIFDKIEPSISRYFFLTTTFVFNSYFQKRNQYIHQKSRFFLMKMCPQSGFTDRKKKEKASGIPDFLFCVQSIDTLNG